ncbi:MAG: heme lyase CcmF/NrfE family subunit [Dehalococcoidia bacterium]
MNIIATLGSASLIIAFSCTVFSLAASLIYFRTQINIFLSLARHSIIATAMLISFSLLVMAYALLSNDFSIAHVASVSSKNMEPWMKWASIYSGQSGSLLFWTWALSLFLAMFSLKTLPKIHWGAPHAIVVMALLLSAFLIPLIFFTSPFTVSTITPEDGRGLNPLLVDRGMLVHPPALLSGLVSTSIPFTLAMSALMSGRLDSSWIQHARSWALLSFLILSVGNFLGAWWAYTVLGWGGYWGWDPVENSAILPLLPIAAFLHSQTVQLRRGIFKGWNLSLVLAAFALAVFGTFNVRSGLVASVHSFAQSDIGPYFLGLLGVISFISIALLCLRWNSLKPDRDLDSLLSKETGLVLNTYILMAITLVILGGTLFPIFSELIQGVRITVGPPFFNETTGPLWIVLLIVMSIGIMLPWRKTTRNSILKRVSIPLIISITTAFFLFILGIRNYIVLLTLLSAEMVLLVTLREFFLGGKVQQSISDQPLFLSILKLFETNQHRYGGYLVHIGVALIAIAIISSYTFQAQTRQTMLPGESFNISGYQIKYEELFESKPGINGVSKEILAKVEIDGKRLIYPGQRLFTNFPNQPVAIVAIDGNPLRDVYVFLQGWTDEGMIELHVFVNPLIQLLWFGGIIYVVGAILAYTPSTRSQETVRHGKIDAR